jgi:sugar/nucleoside kinase (ribokinase family)
MIMIALAIAAVTHYKRSSGQDEETNNSCHGATEVLHDNHQNSNRSQGFKTRELVLDTIREIGCTYEIEEDGDRIIFRYQGATFAIDAEDGCPFINIWYLYWSEYELYDIDNLSRIRKIINEANMRFGTTALFTINNSGGTLDLHSKRNALFIEQIDEVSDYLKALLDDFFKNRVYILTEAEKIKKEEENVKTG